MLNWVLGILFIFTSQTEFQSFAHYLTVLDVISDSMWKTYNFFPSNPLKGGMLPCKLKRRIFSTALLTGLCNLDLHVF